MPPASLRGHRLPAVLADALVFMQLNGQTYPAVLTPGTGSTTFTATVPAPAIPSSVTGTPYPVVVNYTPDNPAFAAPVPPYSFPLTVGPATTTVTQTVTPTSPVVSTSLTVAGTIASSNGLPPAGTLTITVSTAHFCFSRLSHLPHWVASISFSPATQ